MASYRDAVHLKIETYLHIEQQVDTCLSNEGDVSPGATAHLLHQIDNYLSKAGDVNVGPSRGSNQLVELHQVDNHFNNAGDDDVGPSRGSNQLVELHQVDNYLNNTGDVDVPPGAVLTNCYYCTRLITTSTMEMILISFSQRLQPIASSAQG